MPVLGENRLSHGQPAARLRQGGIAVESQPIFRCTVPGEERYRQTDWPRNREPIRDCCISTRCDGGFRRQPFDFWIDATDGNSIMSA
jgi:hypothetical protein